MQSIFNTVGAIIALSAVAGAACGQASYTVTDLGPIGGPSTATAPGSVALDLSDSGAVAGYSVVMDGQPSLRGTLWNGSLTELPALTGDDHSAAMAINSDGVVLGASYSLGDTQPSAVTWNAGVPMMLGSFTPTAINSSGVVVGSKQVDPLSALRDAVVWQSGLESTLGTLGGENSHADDIGDDGRVVGWSSTPTGDLHAFSWQSGVMHDLGTLGGAVSQARAINTAGQVVGVSINSAGRPHAFLAQLNPDGSALSMSDLGELSGGSSYAYDINADGVVVGTSNARAFVWANGVMTDLNTVVDPLASWRLDRATAINASGQIAGVGGHLGLPRAFLLTPISMACNADINGDGVIDTADLGLLIADFGSGAPASDINNDGVVDTADLGMLIGVIGSTCS